MKMMCLLAINLKKAGIQYVVYFIIQLLCRCAAVPAHEAYIAHTAQQYVVMIHLSELGLRQTY